MYVPFVLVRLVDICKKNGMHIFSSDSPHGDSLLSNIWIPIDSNFFLTASQLISALHDTLRSNESSLRENVAATSAFLLLLDDPRSGRATQELSRDMHDTLLEWYTTCTFYLILWETQICIFFVSYHPIHPVC